MKDPDGEGLELRCIFSFSGAADGNNRGKHLRMVGCQAPGTVSSHAQTGEIDATAVNLQLFPKLSDQTDKKLLLARLGP